MRSEQIILDDITTLSSSHGYIHAIAYLSFQSNMMFYSGDMKPDDMRHLFSHERLIRTEISTLLGLLLKNDIDFSLPSPTAMQTYLDKTAVLLRELHDTLTGAFFASFDPSKGGGTDFNPFTSGAVLREPIFYCGESAYSFQYRDFLPRKFARDDEWLKANNGFSIIDCRSVAHAAGRLLDEKITTLYREMVEKTPDQWTYLPAYTFTCQEIASAAAIDLGTARKILQAFAVPAGDRNKQFVTLNDFNVVNSTPLIPAGEDNYVLMSIYSLVESMYESPFFWMSSDRKYVSTAMKHRGQFTEEFATERLSLVFGNKNVHKNIDIFDSRGNKFGEIDVLVVFGNRAIVLQAKSKRLTIEARKGNDLQLRDDFKKSIQDSCDQAYRCAGILGDSSFTLKDAQSKPFVIPMPIKRVYILCLVSDHYPALAFQARQFLHYEAIGSLSPPFILDIFTLDSLTEMLESPLRFLSYIDRRTHYADKFLAMHESVILSYHLKQNLWIKGDADLMVLTDDVSIELDTAMTVRREGIAGKRTPDGILTRFDTTLVGQLVKDIEAEPNPAAIDLGFMLLSLSEDAVNAISDGVDRITQLARSDGNSHDVTIGVGAGDTGLTIHCNDNSFDIAGPVLEEHCVLRKYRQKAKSWFGVCISPRRAAVRFALALDSNWEQSHEMDARTHSLPTTRRSSESMKKPDSSNRKPGRNELCPCGSGKKFKRCCRPR